MNGKLLPLSGLVCLIVMMVLWAPASSTNATTFAPAQRGGVVFSSLAPGANPDITIRLDMLPPSANFSTQAGNLVIFGDGTVATAGDAAIPTGAYVGQFNAVWTLGLNSSECDQQVAVTVNLVDAATRHTTSALIAPAGPPDHVLANLAEDDGDLDNDGFVEAPMFANNGVADGADAYPTFVAEALDPDGGGPLAPIVPLARYFGVLALANQVISVVQLVVMQPGDVAALPNLDWMTGPWGFPMLVFVDNALGPPSNNTMFNITDFCNVSSNINLLGIAADNACTSAAPPAACTAVIIGGFTARLAVSAGCPGDGPPNECGPALGCPCARVTNPAGPSVLTWRQYVVSQRDWDTGAMPFAAAGDGHTNDIDQCPNIVDPAVPFDTDGDGLWDSCDPAPLMSNPDQDGDGWENRLDNCPLVANPQPVPPPPPAPNVAQYDLDIPLGVAVPDGGPRADGIGPACDPNPAGANGHYHATVAAYHICIGAPAPPCDAGADVDGDGVANADDNCVKGANPPIVFPGPDGADVLNLGEAVGSTVLDVRDTTGFTVGSPIVVGSAATLETLRYITAIDPAPPPTTLTINAPLAFAHPPGDIVAQVMFSQSQRDLNADGFVDIIGDMVLLTGAFGTMGGTPGAAPGYQGRFDLNYDNFIDVIGDIALLAGVFGASC